MNHNMKVHADSETLAAAAARHIVDTLSKVLESRDRASLVLTGGSTPRLTYTVLAERHHDALDWSRVDLFMGDERFVPFDHADSNYRMVKESLLTGIKPGNVFPMPTNEESPTRAADVYERTLRDYFVGARPVFDLQLLGLGDDAHVASLFPGSPYLDEAERLVLATTAPAESPVRDRITLTFPAINASRRIFFIVAGANKREAILRTIESGDTPAARVHPREDLIWLVDEAAAPDR